jgi:hypothetical protein
MKKLLLLDADVVIDLHTIGLFDRIIRNYAVHVTKTVLKEAVYFKRSGERIKIDIRDRVTVMEDIGLDYLRTVQGEAKGARLAIDPGELESLSRTCCGAGMTDAIKEFLRSHHLLLLSYYLEPFAYLLSSSAGRVQ